MKKLFLLFFICLTANRLYAQINMSQPIASTELSEAVIDRVTDDNKKLCALISAEVSGLTLEQLQAAKLDTDVSSNIYVKTKPTDPTNLRFYISPAASYIDLSINGYSTERLQLREELVGGRFYTMKIHARPLEVEINIISSRYDKAQVFIDEDYVGNTPLTTKVKYGVPFSIRVVGDRAQTMEGIVISESSEKSFDFTDVTGKKNITLNISHSAEITLDEVNMGHAKGGVPFVLKDVTYGQHRLVVKALDFNDTKERQINVMEKSANEIDIQLEHTQKVTITANVSGAQVRIDGKHIGDTELTTYLTYGKHEMQLSKDGKSKTGTINVTEKNTYFNWKIPKPSTHYSHGYKYKVIDRKPIGWEFGYVNKQWVYKGDVIDKVGFWDGTKYLHGLQTGIRVEPRIGWWFYVHTGLYYEFYYSQDHYDGDTWKFMEHSLYLPVHIDFKMPVSDNFYFFINGGVGFDCGISASVTAAESSDDDPYYTEDGIYNNGDWADMKRFNISGEFGGGFCIKRLKFGCTVSRGLLNMSLNREGYDYTVKQNKIAAYFSLMF